MTRAVLDTNVLVSGIVGFANPASTPGRLLHAWRDGAFDLVLSEPILAEVARTLQAPYFRQRLSAEQVAAAVALLRAEAEIVEIVGEVPRAATHPEDDLILATALSGEADYLVTGDDQLRQPGSHREVVILSPREFLDFLEAHRPG